MFPENESKATVNAVGTSRSLWESDHWDRLQELFHLAAAAEPGERTRILRQACADPLLVDRVLDLLAASAEKTAYTAPVTETVPLGTRVGPYALLRHLGTGGLGSVYLAERMMGGVLQKCAIKVLSMHAAGPQFEARFQREQQILATLDHPNITRLFDAGFSETHQPYLIMEYVDGVDLVRYSDESRLSISERLRMFLQVCDAVAYAHRNLTVHLDLKPSNVLVSTEGQVKLLDFGTSKLIDPQSTLTTTVLATPAYAAPEQLRNEPVTTACDVYGLGAMLFELLCGTRPWGDASTTRRLEQALQEAEPSLLTAHVTAEAALLRGESSSAALKSQLNGDLASIAAQCLRSHPAHRYRSVDALREDLQRYLDGRPVFARRQTMQYRLGKFVRRKRVPLALTAGVALLIAGSFAYAAFRQHQALQQGERAERMQNFLYSVLRLANTNYSGHPATTINDFLQLGVTALPEYIHNATDQRFARLSLGESMFDNSDFQHALPVLLAVRDSARVAGDVSTEAEATAFAGMTESGMGQYKEADQLLITAMTLRDRKTVSAAQRLWIVGFYTSNRYNMGIRQMSDATLLRETIDASRHAAIPGRELAWALGNLATLHSRVNLMGDAEREALEALALERSEPYTACDQSFTESMLGDVAASKGDDAAALKMYQDGYQDIVACKGPDDLGSLELQIPLARLLVRLNRGDEVARLLEPSIAVWRRTLPGNPEIGYVLTTLAQARVQQGRAPEAVGLAGQALTAQSDKFPKSSTAMGLTYAVLAQALEAEGNKQEALAAAIEADGIFTAQPVLARITQRIAIDNKAEIVRLRTKDYR